MGEYHDKQMEVPCLGRPFQLGMLYDCRTESVIPAVTLWDKDILQCNTILYKQESSHFKVITSDSIEEKARLFNMDDEIKLSFLSGLISVGASAKYLENKKSSNRQARVVFAYSCNTFFEQLSMDQLAHENIQHKDVFDKGTATHIVTGVQYGADALFVFDRTLPSDEDCRHVEGILTAKMPNFLCEGEGTAKIKEEEKKEIDKFICTFIGDVRLKENPTTFDDAVNVYRNLPMCINETTVITETTHKERVCGIPKKVYLYPLSKLDNSAAKLVRTISANLIAEFQEWFEASSALLVLANDLIVGEACQRFPGIRDQIEKFKCLISRFTKELQQKLVDILPQIRGGGREEIVLATILKTLKKSPFDIKKLDTWLQAKKRETRILETYLSSLKDCPFASQVGELEVHVHDSSVEFVLVLTFGSITTKLHPFLEEMDVYCNTPEDDNLECDAYDEHWVNSESVVSSLYKQVNLFRQFVAANKTNTNLKCIVVTNSDRKNKSQTPGDMFLYTDSFRKSFQLPSPPGTPEIVSFTECEIEIEWREPQCGVKHIWDYIISYRRASDSRENHGWCHTRSGSKQTHVTIGELEPNTAYQFKVAAIYEVGISEYSQISPPLATKSLPPLVHDFLKTSKLLSAREPNYPAWYLLSLRNTYDKPEDKLRKVEVGTPHHEVRETKVMLLVGATGSGKTTLINGMINYLLGVCVEDNYRFKLIHEDFQRSQAHSQTEYITAYTIHWQPGSKVPFTLVIIDTPGYGDPRGLGQDDKLTEQIKKFFEMSEAEAIDQVDAIGFVAQAPANRLTATQKYVIHAILSVFGHDISNNIFMLLTFADIAKPTVLAALAEENVPYNCYFKFNNAIFDQVTSNNELKSCEYSESTTTTENQSFDTVLWKFAGNSFSQLFDKVSCVEAQSLKLTREVLRERRQLEKTIEHLQCEISSGINWLAKSRELIEAIEENQDRIDRDFLTTFVEQRRKDHWAKRILGESNFITNYSDLFTLMRSLKLKDQLQEENVTEKANLLNEMTKEYNNAQMKVIKYIETIRKSLSRLDEISMRKNPLTVVDYIEVLIQTNQNEKKKGWQFRLEELEEARRKAKMIQKMVEEGMEFDPLKEDREQFIKKAQTSTVLKWIKGKLPGNQ